MLTVLALGTANPDTPEAESEPTIKRRLADLLCHRGPGEEDEAKRAQSDFELHRHLQLRKAGCKFDP